MSIVVKYGKGMPYDWYNISYGEQGYNEDVYTTGIPHIVVGHRSSPIIAVKLYDDREMDDKTYQKMFDITEDIKKVCENVSRALHEYSIRHYMYVECISICDEYGNKQFMGVSYDIHTDGTIYLRKDDADGDISLEAIVEEYIPRLLKDNNENIEISSSKYQERKYISPPKMWVSDIFLSLPEGYKDRRDLEPSVEIDDMDIAISSGRIITMKDKTRNRMWTVRMVDDAIIETTIAKGKSIPRKISRKNPLEYIKKKIEKMKRSGYDIV